MELRDKVAVITGGSGGIGRAMAKAFLAEGAKGVMLADLNEGLVSSAAKELGCLGIACDVTDESQIQALVKTAILAERFRRHAAKLADALNQTVHICFFHVGACEEHDEVRAVHDLLLPP